MKCFSGRLFSRVGYLFFCLGMALFAIAAQAKTLAYVANSASSSVSVIDTTTNTVTATVPVGLCPTGVAITPDAARVYVTNQCSNSVSVIDTASNAVVATIGVGSIPVGVAIAPNGTRAYVANADYSANSVSVIDTASNTLIATGRHSPASMGCEHSGRHPRLRNSK